MKKFIAIYARVSSKRQELRSQEPDLQRWVDAQDQQVQWFRDKCTGTKMERPAWNKFQDAIRAGRVSTIVVWRVDRLGRTARGLTALFEELRQRKVNLISLRDGIDLSTPAGRMLANVLASIAQFETELRGERVAAGQAVARANGKRWGGSKKGVRKVVTPLQEKLIRDMRKQGESVVAIADAVKLSRPTVYNVLSA